MTKKVNLFVLVSLFFVTGYCVSQSPVHTTVPKVQTPVIDEETGARLWWIKRHNEKLEQLAERAGKVDLLWLGDSITHGWEYSGKNVWDEYYASRDAFNLGFSGDTTENVLWRIEHGEIHGLNPKLAILMIGTNNAAKGQGSAPDSPEETAAGIAAIIARLHVHLPQTHIVLLAIFPRGATPDDPLRQRNNKVNKLIAHFGKHEYVHYLDINHEFLDSKGHLNRQLMPDFLHPNEQGYKIWAEAIEPTVKDILTDNCNWQ